ncbi:MAG: DUF5320 domain-containing protein [bacterium]
MPRGDRTGPAGQGPRTGRNMGYCAGYSVPGYMNAGPGLGLGMGRGLGGGRGGGRGWRNMYYATGLPGWARAGWLPAYGQPPAEPYGFPPYAPAPTTGDEADLLKAQAEYFERGLEDIKTRLAELERKAKEEK